MNGLVCVANVTISWRHSANLPDHPKTIWRHARKEVTSCAQGSTVVNNELRTISLYSSYFELHHALQACFCSSYSMLTKQACLLNCTIPCRLHALQLACISYYAMLAKQACLCLQPACITFYSMTQKTYLSKALLTVNSVTQCSSKCTDQINNSLLHY